MKFKLVKLNTIFIMMIINLISNTNKSEYQTGCALKATRNKQVFSLHLKKKALVGALGVVGLVAVVRVLAEVHVVAVEV